MTSIPSKVVMNIFTEFPLFFTVFTVFYLQPQKWCQSLEKISVQCSQVINWHVSVHKTNKSHMLCNHSYATWAPLQLNSSIRDLFLSDMAPSYWTLRTKETLHLVLITTAYIPWWWVTTIVVLLFMQLRHYFMEIIRRVTSCLLQVIHKKLGN